MNNNKIDPIGNRRSSINKARYMRGPTIEEINAVIGTMRNDHFELLFGIYKNCIAQVRMGFRKLPRKHWHIIFENLPDSSEVEKIINRKVPVMSDLRAEFFSKKRAKKKKRKVVFDEKIRALL